MRYVLFPLIVLAVVLGMAIQGRAHMAQTGWQYEAWCCNGNGHTGDCQQIPMDSVKPVQGGWQITLKPGDHRLVTKRNVYFKSYSDTRISPDGFPHACLFPTEATLRCFYMPPFGS